MATQRGLFNQLRDAVVIGAMTLMAGCGSQSLKGLDPLAKRSIASDGSIASLVFSTQPHCSSCNTDSAISTAPIIKALDSAGKVVSDSSTAIVLNVYSDSICSTLFLPDITPATHALSSGVADFSATAISIVKTGTVYLGATDGTHKVCSSTALTIAPGAVSTLAFAPGYLTSVTAGTSVPLSVTAYDAHFNVVTTSSSAVTVTSTDGAAILPSPALTTGAATFSTSLRTVGSQTITAVVSGKSISTSTITVSPGAAAALVFTNDPGTGSPTYIAGTIIPAMNQPVVRVVDAYNNVKTDYVGSITLAAESAGPCGSGTASTFGAATNPSATISGVATFSGAVFSKTSAGQIYATAGGLSACSSTFTVNPGSVNSLVFTPGYSTSVATGGGLSLTVTAYDANLNVVTTSSAAVTVTSTDGAAILPSPPPTLISGVATFSTTLNTAGTQTITAAASGKSVTTSSVIVGSGGAWASTGSMTIGRQSHTSTLLPNGKVLLVGGSDTYNTSTYLSSADLYDPRTGTTTATGSMSTPRIYHTATLLPNGKVLIVGGETTGNAVTNSAEIYDPVAGTFSATLVNGYSSYGHTAVLLMNGKVLISGGYNGATYIANSSLYDPVAGAFSVTPSMNSPRLNHTATLLPNGKVLISAGYNAGSLASAELYDPVANTYSVTGSLSQKRHAHSATLLPNGKVLVTCGTIDSGSTRVTATELYDFNAGTFSATGSIPTGRLFAHIALMPNGNVIVAGGEDSTNASVTTTDVYDPVVGTFGIAGALGTGRFGAAMTVLWNGAILVTGGISATSVFASAELFTPTGSNRLGTFTTTGAMANARDQHTSLLLWNGKVLISGGSQAFHAPQAASELFDYATNTFSATGSMVRDRLQFASSLLPNGYVLVNGGYSYSASGRVSSCELNQ